jgi:SecY interacting protein Syd
MNGVQAALDTFIARAAKARGTDYFEARFDPDWRSPCEKEVDDESGIVRWYPLRQDSPVDFRGLANALEAPVHPDIFAYYGTFWSGHFEAESKEGHVSLIQLWNPDDFERLIENLIGHLLSKQRAKQPFTVFFANTEPDSELFLSIDNQSGKVLLEEPGRAPIREVETDIASFIDRLTPLDTKPGIY